MKINNFRVDLTDISAKKEALDTRPRRPRVCVQFDVQCETSWAVHLVTMMCQFSSSNECPCWGLSKLVLSFLPGPVVGENLCPLRIPWDSLCELPYPAHTLQLDGKLVALCTCFGYVPCLLNRRRWVRGIEWRRIWQTNQNEFFCYSRNICYVTPKIIYSYS